MSAQQQQPPPAAVFYQEVSWSPDGSRLGFTMMRGTGSKGMKASINVMGADGSDARRVTDERTVAFYGAWSPDGRRIAFASSRDGDGQKRAMHVYVMNADGSNVRKLTP